MFRLLPFIALLALVQPSRAETATVEGSAGGANDDATVTVIIDSDRDGLTDAEEATLGTDPGNPDTDGDGLTDKAEVDAGGNPLVNNFDAIKADPDWLGIPESIRTASNFSSFWDFNTHSNGFPSRKGTAKLTPFENGIQSTTNIWNQTEGYYPKSTDLGPGRYLRMDPVPTFVNYIWTAGFALKLDGDPGTTPLPLLGGYASQTAQAGDSFRVELVNGTSLVRPSTNGNLLRAMVGAAGSVTVTGEWLVPSSVDFKEWNEVLVRVNDDNTFTNTSRHCYINGTKLNLLVPSGGSGWTVLGGSTNIQHKAVQFGAALSATGAVTTSPQNFSLDRVYFGQGPGAATTLETLTDRDSDGDGISDREEYLAGSDPFHYSPDIDRDGLTNSEEAAGQATFDGLVKSFGATDPSYFDSDGDLFDDYWEAKYFWFNVDPNDPAKPIKDDPGTPGIIEGDYDSDGLSNYLELIHGTDPNNADTDGDGISDKDEADYGSDPADPADRPLDPSQFYGEDILDPACQPVGALDVILKPEDGKHLVKGSFGDHSSSHSERWRLKFEGKGIVNQEFGEVEDFAVQLSGDDFWRVSIEHVGTNGDPEDPFYPNYDYKLELDEYPGFILCDEDELQGEFLIVEDNLPDNYWVDKRAWLVPTNGFSWATSFSGSDAVGPRHRKIALNGRPLADEKPQQEEESDLPDEETYIDAFNLSLHHDTTFAYIPLGASDLVLQATASTAETGFSDRSGLRPNERFDLPFGAGWTSNLCSYIEVVETLGDESDDPVTVNVIDEAGRPQRFGTRNFHSFFPWPSSRVDKKTYLNTLSRNGTNFTLEKKFGNSLTFTPGKAWFLYSTDRAEGSTKVRRHTYWRLSEVRDRYGVRLRYDYGPNEVTLIPREISSPDREGHFLAIQRSADCRRIEAITDSRGHTTEFNYNYVSTAGPPPSEPPFATYPVWNDDASAVVANAGYRTPLLESVDYADGTSTAYGYDPAGHRETDASDPENFRLTHHYYVSVDSIEDKRGNVHGFTYGFDRSKRYWDSNISGTRAAIDLDRLPAEVKACVEEQLADQNDEAQGSWKPMSGLSRRISRVDLPGSLGFSTFSPSGTIDFGATVTATGHGTTVVDAESNTTVYQFTGTSAELVDIDGTANSVSYEWMVYYLTSTIHHGALEGQPGHIGKETYQFDLASGLSLWKATDMSGNETTWEFGHDLPSQPVGLTNPGMMTKWADPTAKIDALARREDYDYESFRVMSRIDDPFGTVTNFDVDPLGRRRFKTVTGAAGDLIQERYDYTNQRFKAFQTGSTILAFSSVSGQVWEIDLKTGHLPDANGRMWREIVDPGGEKLVTEHAYDFNNNRVWTLDPRGNRTRFKYDKLNRLVEVTHPSAGTRAGETVTTKQIWYDENGNKAAEIDEEGHYTIHHYDALNRRITTIRDMDGAGLPTRNVDGVVTEAAKGGITGNDLVTRMEYNAVGSVIRQTDPRGIVTRTFFDSIQRAIHVFSGLTAAEAAGDVAACTAAAAGSTEKTHTEFRYTDTGLNLPEGGAAKGNPGGTAFDTSGFKPTEMIRHDAVLTATGTIDLHTYAAYDALYRPLRTEAEYESGAFAVTTSTYGDGTLAAIKEALETTAIDDRGKVTKTLLDGLQRPVSVIDAFGTALAAETETVYASTGLVWKTIDSLLRETETEFDGVGRPVAVWQPDPVTGLVNRNTPNDPLLGSPRTRTAYDKNGNVVVSINPLGYRWEYEYDARNRRVIERQPTVTETTIVGGLPEETAFQSPEIQTAYDGIGNVIAVTDAREHTTRSFHDRANRVTAMLTNPVTGDPSDDPQDPGANDIVIRTDFDPNGNALEVLDGNGNATRNQYDRLNRLVATATNPNDGDPNAPPAAPKTDDIVVSNQFDDSGNIVRVEDGEGRLAGFRYDGRSRKTRTLWDEGSAVQRVEQASFDGIVQLTRVRNPGEPSEQTTTYQYDSLNRMENVLYTGTATDNRHYDYDLVGNLLDITYVNDPGSVRESGQVFDKLNRLVEETSAGATHVHTYDKAGNRRTTEYAASGRFLTCTYDKLNRLLTCIEKPFAASTVENLTGYGYDLNGNVTRKVLPNGSANLSTFDALNRKLTEATRNGGGTGGLISTFDYSQPTAGYPFGYDSVGNLLKIVEAYGHANVNNRSVTNVYDRVYRLDTETIVETGGPTITTAYEYDDANNRTEKAVTGGSNPGTWISAYGTTADGYNSNQLKTVTKGGVVTGFLYDPNGNRTSKTVGGATVQTYGFDFENRLTSLTDSVKGTFAYSYDHRTRRVGRDESSASGTADQISFAGGLSVQEYLGSATTPTVEYIRGSDYGGGIGGVLYTIRGGSTRSYNAYNSRGDVVSKTNEGGAITWQAAYEAFGTRTDEEGSTLDRQKANTKDEDPTGLLNEGMRYRDLEFGIFLTRDPAGFVDGPNVYTYVMQNPWTFFDPLGLQGKRTAGQNASARANRARWETNGGWGGVAAGAWAGLGRGLNDMKMIAAHASPGMWLDAGLSKLSGQKSGLQDIRESTAAYNQEISSSVAEFTGTDADSPNFKGGQTGGEILAPGLPAIKGGQVVAKSVQKGLQKTAKEIAEETVEQVADAAPRLTQNQASQVRKVNNAVDDHLTDMDLSGAVADQMGSPIPKPGGGFWDHAKEVGEAMGGVRKRVKKLENVDHPEAREAVKRGREALDRAEDAIKGAGI